VAGVHIMSVDWTKSIPMVVERAGLLPRPPLPEEAAEAVEALG
jgi:methylenetetrahydrofolate reductase (NADPH)